MKLQVTLLLGMLLTVYGYPAPPVKRSPQSMFGPLVPSLIPQRTSGVSVAVDTAPQYPDLSYEPMIPYPMMEPSPGISVIVDTVPDYDDDYLRPYALYKRQTTPIEYMTSPPSRGSVNPMGSMMSGLPAVSQGPLNPLTSASRGLPGVGQLFNPASATSRLPVDQIPGMQMLPMQQLNPSTLLGY